MVGDSPVENRRRVREGEPDVEDASSHSFSSPFDSLLLRSAYSRRRFVKAHILFICDIVYLHHRVLVLFLIIVIPVLQILVFRLPQMRLHRAQRSGYEHHAFKPKLLQHDPIHFLSRRAKIHRWFRHDEPTFFYLRLRNFQHLVYAMRPNIFLQLRIGQIPSIDRSSNDETVNIWNVFRVDTYNRRFRALRAARAVRDQRRRGTLARESDFNRIAAVV
mmetsp:Transcript_1414/g.4433  ORF Transcript_1414/g.4433 Transcript_1414/m.4433 type:complete len:218 (-) Transcript_1414:4594-5247(-)